MPSLWGIVRQWLAVVTGFLDWVLGGLALSKAPPSP